MPIHLPQFILNWISFIKKISQFKEKGLYVEVYFRHILIYFFLLLLCLFMLDFLA